MFLYEFDLFGILYTVLAAALSVLLIIATAVFGVRKKRRCGTTIAFRVLDIILFVLLGVLWILFVFSKLGLSTFAVSAGADDSLAISFGDAALSLPFAGGIINVWNSALGIILISVVTVLSVLSFAFSCVFRRKREKADDGMISADTYYSDVEPIDAEPADIPEKPEPASETETEEKSADAPPIASDSSEISGAAVVAAEPAPEAEPAAEEENAEPSVRTENAATEETGAEHSSGSPEDGTGAAESLTEPDKTADDLPQAVSTVSPQRKDFAAETAGYDYLTERRGTSSKVYSSALQMPGAKKLNDKERAAIADRL